MSIDSAHLDETLHELLDGRLGPEERARAEEHLAACPRCRRELKALRVAKDAVARGLTRHELPAALGDGLGDLLDAEDRGAPSRLTRRAGVLRPVMAVAAVLLVALSVFLVRGRRAPDLPAAVAKDYAAFRDGRLALETRSTNPAEVERFFAAHGIRFPTRVFDLGMMGYRVAGGRVHSLAGRPSALFVYDGEGGKRLLCQMYEGRPSELPAGAVRREHNGIVFHVYEHEGLTLVFWPEGGVMCVLVSDIGAEEVIQLAFAKAMIPA